MAAVMVSVAAVACNTEKNEPEKDAPVVTITSAERLVVAPEGGDFSVTFNVSNPVDGVSAILESEVDWITEPDYSTEGSIGFTVSPNDNGTSREAMVNIVYDWSGTKEPAIASFIVSQDADVEADVKIDCKYVHGEFYGDLYTMSGEQMYYLNISDLGFTESGTVNPDGSYYQLAFFTGEEPADLNNLEIPDGVYTVGEMGLTEAGTIGADYSRYFVSNSAATDYADGPFYLAGGSISVSSDNGEKFIEGVIETEDGRTHHIYYRGKTNITLYNLGFAPVDYDHSVDEVFIGGSSYISETNGVMNISMIITQKNNGDEFSYPTTAFYFDMNCPADKYGIVPGTYTISDSGDPYTIPSGKIEIVGGNPSFTGAHIIIFEENGLDKAALITGGSITFAKDGNIYTVVGDLTSVYGKKFTFEYVGEINIPNIPGDGFSTLTDDITVDLTGATGFVAYWGDEYGTGNGRYDISLNSAEWGGESVFFDIAAAGLDCSGGIPSGTYKAASGDVPGAGEYVRGYQDERGVLWGTRYEGGYDEIGFINVCAPALSGDLVIVNNGNDMYDVSFEFFDDKGYKWSGSWSGEISLVDFSDF